MAEAMGCVSARGASSTIDSVKENGFDGRSGGAEAHEKIMISYINILVLRS